MYRRRTQCNPSLYGHPCHDTSFVALDDDQPVGRMARLGLGPNSRRIPQLMAFLSSAWVASLKHSCTCTKVALVASSETRVICVSRFFVIVYRHSYGWRWWQQSRHFFWSHSRRLYGWMCRAKKHARVFGLGNFGAMEYSEAPYWAKKQKYI